VAAGEFLINKPLDAGTIAQAASMAAAVSEPVADRRGETTSAIWFACSRRALQSCASRRGETSTAEG
jgi:hypothetical protein